MRKLILTCLCAASAFAAEYSIPSASQPASGTWQAAGVPGGIPTRETIYTTITSTGSDQSSAINSAILASPSGQVVKLGAGTFRVDSTIVLGYGRQVTLRGTLGENGERLTTLDVRGSTGVQLGTNYNYNFPAGGVSVVTSSLTKGATTIEVSDSTHFSVGQLVLLQMENDPSYPIFNVYPMTARLQSQWVRIASKPDSTHYTIDAPGLHGDYTTAPSAILQSDENNFWSGSCGIEDLIIDGANGAPMQVAVNVDNSYGSWVLNVAANNFQNYAFKFNASYRCEVRRSESGPADPAVHTTSGFTPTLCSSLLFIDNIVGNNAFLTLIQEPNSGHVIAYNLFVDTATETPTPFVGQLNSNHGPWCQYILFEGNLFPNSHSDGYYGGSGYETFYRNWAYGGDLDETTGLIPAILFRRGVRYPVAVGNHIGRTGASGSIGFGSPNMSNSNDIAPGHTSRMCVAELTTRTSDTAGTITAPSGHGVTTGATIDVMWLTEEASYYITKIRRGVTVGTVSGTSIPFSGGEGDTLPAALSDMYVPTSNSALWNWWGDWDAVAQYPKEWTGTLTTRTTDNSGVITLDSGQAADFTTQWSAAYQGQRGLEWDATAQAVSIIVTGVTGDEVTFTSSSSAIPALSTPVRLTPSNFGFQEVDMDTHYTALLKGNYYVAGGVPAVESLGGDTLQPSLFLSSEPQFFTEASLTWPPITPGSVTESYDIIPAGQRYLGTGATTVATPQFSPTPGTHAAGTEVSISGGTTGATYYYTVNGDTPTTSSTLYTGPIALSTGTTVLKAIGVKAEMADSSVQTGSYTLVTTPTAPSGLTATATSSAQINLAWTDNSSTETGFRIERRVGAGSWSTVTTTAANATSYSNTGLSASTTYEYRVYALNVAGDSSASNTDSATTQSEGGGAANATINNLTVDVLHIP